MEINPSDAVTKVCILIIVLLWLGTGELDSFTDHYDVSAIGFVAHDFRKLKLIITMIVADIVVGLLKIIFQKRRHRHKIRHFQLVFPLSYSTELLTLVVKLCCNQKTSESVETRYFFNWQHIFNLFWNDVEFVFKFYLFKLIKFISRYGINKVLRYLFITLVLAISMTFLFFFPMEQIALFIRDSFKNLHRDNFITVGGSGGLRQIFTREITNHSGNSSFPFPTENYSSYHLNVSLFSSHGIVQYRTHDLRRSSYQSKTGNSLPFERHIFKRQLGEDVEFVCGFVYYPCYNYKFPDVFWKKDGKFMESLKQEPMERTFRMENSTCHVSIRIYLFDIKPRDYGQYQCIHREVVQVGQISPPNGRSKSEFLTITDYMMGHYHLMQKFSERNFVYAPHGSILLLNWSPVYLRNDNSEVSYKYTINGKDMTLNKKFNAYCSTMTYIYYIVSMAYGFMDQFSMSLEVSKSVHIQTYNFNHQVQFSACSGPDVYGIHELTIFREFMDVQRNKSVLKSFQYSESFFVLSDTAYISSFDNESRYFKEYSYSNIHSAVSRLTKTLFYTTSDAYCFWIRLVLETVLFISGIVLAIKIFRRAHQYIMENIVLPMQRRALDDYYFALENPAGEIFGNILILNSDTDNELAFTEIVQAIENGTILPVCFPERDFAEYGNRSRFELYGEALYHARQCILCLTDNFSQDNECLNLKLDCVLSNIEAGNMSRDDILVVDFGVRHWPEKLVNILPNVEVLDWMEITSKKKRSSGLCSWIKRENKRKRARPNEIVVVTTILPS